jgi:hypothetical protein
MGLRLIITSILTVWVFLCNAQTIRFNKVNQLGSLINYNSKGLYINDSVFVCIQNTLNTVNSQAGITFSKFDKSGIEIFSKSYLFDTSIINGPISVCLSSDSFIYGLCQTYYQHVSDPQLYIIKFRLNGDTVWLKRTGKPQAIEGFYQLIETNDKKMAGVGFTEIAADGWSKSHVTLMKIDTNGTVLWQKDYGPNGKHSYGWGVVETPTHGFLISGYRSNGTNINPPFNDEDDYLAIKTDSAGNAIWSKYYGTLHNEDAGLGIVKCKNGGYYLLGTTDSFNILYPTYYSEFIKIIKIDENGILIWTNKYGVYSSNQGIRNGYQLYDGSIVSYGLYIDSTNNKLNALLLKIDSLGNQKWLRSYTYPSAKINPWALTHCPDGGFLMSGFVNYDIVQPADGWLLKVDSFGCLVGGCEQWDEVIEIETTNNEQLVVYPNPATNQIIISCDDIYTITQLQIIDILGKVVLESKIANLDEPSFNNKATSTKEVTIASINKGIYIVQAIFKNGKSKTVKFVKQ